VHHFALLIGYGAAAVNPYLALESVAEMVRDGLLGELSEREAFRRYLKAASKGVLKVMSKMGISTVASYTGPRSSRRSGSIGDWRTGTSMARRAGWAASGWQSWPRRWPGAIVTRTRGPGPARERLELEVGGEYKWRRGGEYHLFNPETVFKLQHATRAKRFDIFREYSASSTSSPSSWRPCAACCGYAPATLRCGHRSPRGGGAGRGHRAALCDRRHVVRVDLR